MRAKELLLWDLDGTLTDPAVGITSAVQHALRYFHIDEPDRQKLTPFIGPPLKEAFMQMYGFSETDAAIAVSKYREYFTDVGIFQNELYPGIPALLSDLKARGKTLALATSKPTVFAVRILDHFQIAPFFSFVSGCELDGTRGHKREVIDYALERCDCRDKSKAVMIGDRYYDIDGARAAGIDSIGVVYGYGTRDELEQAGAGIVAESLDQLRQILV